MSLDACLLKLRGEGSLPDDTADDIARYYEDLVARYGREMSLEAAQVRATRETVVAFEAVVADKKRTTLLGVAVQGRIWSDLQGYQRRGKRDINRATEALFDRDEYARYDNVEARRKTVRAQAHARMTDVLATFRRRITGDVREPATLEAMVRSAFGEETGNPVALELAQAWHSTSEWLRARFNAAGGHIRRLEDWGLPQTHDTLKIRRADFDTWRGFILPRLDRRRMLDHVTGIPLDDAKLDRLLKGMYENIRTEGIEQQTPGVTGGVMLANRRADSRVLHFASADGWLEYQQRFGAANPLDAMIGHIDGMARDIALMEILGPNPTATVRWVQDMLRRDSVRVDVQEAEGIDARMAPRDYGTIGERASRQANQTIEKVQRYYDLLRGATNAPVNMDLAEKMATTRTLLTAAQLGSATLSAVSDLVFSAVTTRYLGASYTKVLGHIPKLFTVGVSADQKMAVQAGLGAESWISMASAAQRYAGEVSGHEIARRLGDATMRLSLLAPWTQAGRWAFGLELMGNLGRALEAKTGWDALDVPVRNALVRYDISAADWVQLGGVALHRRDAGPPFLRPVDVADSAALGDGGPVLADKLLRFVLTETEFAVPSQSLRARDTLTGGLRPGTLWGEVVRSVAQYKGFAITLAHTHMARLLAQPTAGGRAAYAARILIGTTLMGGLAVQLKDVAAGREPRPADNKEFWGAALLQGGGLGIFGDFLNSDTNRFGGSLVKSLAGPTAGLLDDVARLTVGNVHEGINGKDTHLGRELTAMVARYTPVASSLWYEKLAFQRLVTDQAQKMVDEDAQALWDKREAKRLKEYDQEYWWPMGEPLPVEN